MRENNCPVNEMVLELNNVLQPGCMKNPRSRRIVEEIRDLARDIAWGSAGPDHIPMLDKLQEELAERISDPEASPLARRIRKTLDERREVFISHVKTRNCATGDCVKLAPAPCQMACPAGIDIPSYVTLIGMGRDAEAIEVIRQDNPFPWVCGLVCTRPCEFMCVRGRIDKPVSIKFLKAFAAERAMSDGRYVNPPREPDKGKKVCVIGAGPGGLSCAYYLSVKGYGVTVIESLPAAGGMLRVGIPRYRLPAEVIDRETAMLEDLGVEFRFNTRFGSDVTFEQLKQDGYAAFFVAIGAHSAYKLGIQGESEYGAIEAVDFLRRVALGEHRRPGGKVVVVGGGNVAIDSARTCLRLGCAEVTLAYRRTHKEMPADEEEVEQAEEEGIHFSFLAIPVEITGEAGRTSGLKCLRAKLEPVGDGQRMRPVPIDGSEYVIEADAVIAAIGQQVDRDCMVGLKDMNWSRRNTIHVNTVSMETSLPGVFAAGDAVTGPATVIEAIGGGKRAAQAIDRYLMGIPQPSMPPVPVRRARVENIEVPAATKMSLKRPEMPVLNIDRRRTTFQQVELGYPENAVREEARRCLRCDICRRCGECVSVCRDMMKLDALQLGYFDFDHPVKTDFRTTRDKCILCGSCANHCPNQAMQIHYTDTECILTLCGTVLNRGKLVFCEGCGKMLGTTAYLDYVRRRIESTGNPKFKQHLCDVCQRKKAADIASDIMLQR